MRVKLLSTARVKTKHVRTELVLAQADLHESNSDLEKSMTGTQKPTRESVEAALVQSGDVELQLSDAVQELEAVTELLRVVEARIDESAEASTPARSGQGAASA